MTDTEQLKRCEWEISQALAASQEERPLAERMGVLLWEMDWRAERESILAESADENSYR